MQCKTVHMILLYTIGSTEWFFTLMMNHYRQWGYYKNMDRRECILAVSQSILCDRNRMVCTCDNTWHSSSHFRAQNVGNFLWHCVTNLPNRVAKASITSLIFWPTHACPTAAQLVKKIEFVEYVSFLVRVQGQEKCLTRNLKNFRLGGK